MVQEDGNKAIRKLEQRYKQIDTERSFVNYDGKHINFMKLENSFIGTICSKLSNIITKVAKFIAKHTIGCIAALISVLILLN